MKLAWSIQLLLFGVLICSEVYSKGRKKNKWKSPDVLKEFRSFADSVIPEEKALSTPPSHGFNIKEPVMYVDEPKRQVTKKVTFAATDNRDDDEVKNVYEHGPTIQKDDIGEEKQQDDDEVDTYIDDKEEDSEKAKATKSRKEKKPFTGAKAGRSIRLQINHSQPELKVSINNTDATTERTQLQKAEKTAVLPAETTASATNPPEQCIATCPATCAPECTPQCCTQDTAPPPVKKVHTPEIEKKIRWYERPRYEPGPNVPPPIFPQASSSGCDASCSRSCTPSCKEHGCCKVKSLRPVVGCSSQCTPNMCPVGCPAHCCARYMTSADPVLSIR